MKKTTTVMIGIAFIIAIGISFFAGHYTNEQKHINNRLQRCQTFISSAIDKVENEEISDRM